MCEFKQMKLHAFKEICIIKSIFLKNYIHHIFPA